MNPNANPEIVAPRPSSATDLPELELHDAGDALDVTLSARPGESYLIVAGPEPGSVLLPGLPFEVDLGPDVDSIVLAFEGQLETTGRVTHRMELPETPDPEGQSWYWQAILFGPEGLAKTALSAISLASR